MKSFVTSMAVALALTTSAVAQGMPSTDGARVYFVNLSDGETVSSPVKIVFGLEGMGVAPAGTEKEGTGHHHLLLNRPPLGQGEEGEDELLYGLPADDNHIHFGGGQTEVSLDLPAGEHTLQLVLGDLNHVPHDKPIFSDMITISVK